MYSRMLIPLDGSEVAEQVLPYARFLAKALTIPVELLEVVDREALSILVNPEQARYIDTLLRERIEAGRSYLDAIARSFQGTQLKCFVEKGNAEDVVIERAATHKDTLIVMATHGRSAIERWLLGSVADKVLHGSNNHLFLIRAKDQGKIVGETVLKRVIVPLDGSSLAEKVLPYVVEVAKKMSLEVIFMRAYALPPPIAPDEYGTYTDKLIGQIEAESRNYLEEKTNEVKGMGLENVSSVVNMGYGAGEIITLARNTPDNFIAMCTHGRSGIKRWALGSVAERVVRHSGDPVLLIRAS